MSDCRLCGLPTPDPPVTATDGDVDGEFCCPGCLEVARALGETEGPTEGAVDGVSEAADGETATGDGETPVEVPEGYEETYLAVDGMHCTTCEAFLAVRGDRTEGVHTVEANYAVETARVVYDPAVVEESALPELLSGRGYTLAPRSEDVDARARQQDTVQRLVIGGFFSMLVMPWYLFYLYPGYLGIETGIVEADATSQVGLYIPLVFIGLFTTVVLFYTGYPVLRGAWVSLRTGHPNMDLLVSVAALSAYAYSTVALATGSTHLYYDVSVAVVMVVTVGRFYETRIRARANDALSALTAARVDEATRIVEDGHETVSVDALSPGDRVVVKPGERVPVDGTVREGVAAVDESVLTGESLPTTRRPGEAVIGGSIVRNDALVVEVGPDAESTVDRIAASLWEIQASSPGIQRLADALATIFVPLVLVLGTVVAVWQLAAGSSVAAALLAGLTVLVVSCPCAMGLATPLAISGGLRDALARGIVVTNASLFEVAPRADTVVFDKTGTLTAGEMDVTEAYGDDRTLARAGAVEQFASHPVAEAIVNAAVESASTTSNGRGEGRVAADGGVVAEESTVAPAADGSDATTAVLPEATEFRRHPGEGVAGTVDGQRVVVGTPGLVEERVGSLPESLAERVEAIERDGGLPVVVGWEGRARGVVAVGDRARSDWEQAVEAFEDHRVAVLTGDQSPPAAFGEHPAVDRVFAGVPPDGKVETVRRLAAEGTTVMVGDGTNDAPALAAADLGVAMGEGTARAADAADVVLTDEDLTAIETVFDLADGTHRRIRENIAWAFLYNGIAIPLAVVGLINPLFAAVAMAASSLLVVSNSRRSVMP